VPRSCKEEGHRVLKLENNGDGTFEMYVAKGPDDEA
jgi:TusA-related sulfurtransferase